MKLHLGCANDLKPGWRNVDCVPQAHQPGIDFEQADLNLPWPWPISSVDAILAHDLFEHILDCQHVGGMVCPICDCVPQAHQTRAFHGQIHCLNESWRVLKPGGILDMKVPAVYLSDGQSGNPGAFCDPTHRTFWHEDIRYYICEEWNHPNGERGRLGPGMGIECLFKAHAVRTIDYGEGREKRSKLCMLLEAVK